MFGRLYTKLDEIILGLRSLEAVITSEGRSIMAKLEDLVTQLNDETNAVSARIDKIAADLAAAQAAGQAPSQASLDALQSISDRLKVLGSDPAAPIPPDATPAA